MNQGERNISKETVASAAYELGKSILDSYGFPGVQETLRLIPRPGRPALKHGPNIPTIQAPVVPVEIGGNEYRLWLRQRQDGENKELNFTVHYQQLPYGLDRFEFDDEGRISAYWFKPHDKEQLQKVGTSDLGDNMPNAIHFTWYMVYSYDIGQGSIKSEPSENVPAEIATPIKDDSEFVLSLLQQMQTRLQQPDFVSPSPVSIV